jgi:hypothetical protein
MRTRSVALAFTATLTFAAVAPSAGGQYTMDRHPAVAADSAGAAVLSALRVDLSRLRLAQDSFYVAHRTYAADTAGLGWRPASGAVFRIMWADSTTWVAKAEHSQLVGPEVLTVRRTADALRRP